MHAFSILFRQRVKLQMLKFVTRQKRNVDMSADYDGNAKKVKSDDNTTAAATAVNVDSLKKGFVYEEKKGDLFKCPPGDCLTHCISEDVRMGKGIATLFKKKFGGIQDLLDQKQKPGGVSYLKRDGRYVYYLITKAKYWQKPTYATLESSLLAMREHCQSNNVQGVSMPKIGCGLDGLQWDKVRDMLHKVFADSNMAITVYYI